MACIKREQYGHCAHTQCPFPDESGVECVDVVKNFCEIGDGCITACQWSWDPNDTEKTAQADAVFIAELKSLLEGI